MKNTKEPKLINCGNDFYQKHFEELCEALEQGQAVEPYIACIGHTRNNMGQEAYKEALKKKYGENLNVQYHGGACSYHYSYTLNK